MHTHLLWWEFGGVWLIEIDWISLLMMPRLKWFKEMKEIYYSVMRYSVKWLLISAMQFGCCDSVTSITDICRRNYAENCQDSEEARAVDVESYAQLFIKSGCIKNIDNNGLYRRFLLSISKIRCDLIWRKFRVQFGDRQDGETRTSWNCRPLPSQSRPHRSSNCPTSTWNLMKWEA